jgi:hypothetical protein
VYARAEKLLVSTLGAQHVDHELFALLRNTPSTWSFRLKDAQGHVTGYQATIDGGRVVRLAPGRYDTTASSWELDEVCKLRSLRRRLLLDLQRVHATQQLPAAARVLAVHLVSTPFMTLPGLLTPSRRLCRSNLAQAFAPELGKLRAQCDRLHADAARSGFQRPPEETGSDDSDVDQTRGGEIAPRRQPKVSTRQRPSSGAAAPDVHTTGQPKEEDNADDDHDDDRLGTDDEMGFFRRFGRLRLLSLTNADKPVDLGEEREDSDDDGDDDDTLVDFDDLRSGLC